MNNEIFKYNKTIDRIYVYTKSEMFIYKQFLLHFIMIHSI